MVDKKRSANHGLAEVKMHCRKRLVLEEPERQGCGGRIGGRCRGRAGRVVPLRHLLCCSH